MCRRIPGLALNACLETCMIMIILDGSQPFSWVLTAQQTPQLVCTNPIFILNMLNFFFLLVGLSLEVAPGVIIPMPMLLPVIQSIGMDPIRFGWAL